MTTPLDRTDLQALIKYHRDILFSNRWLMSKEAETRLRQTIQVLEHYRDLCDVIDLQEPEKDPLDQEPRLLPDDAEPIKEQIS